MSHCDIGAAATMKLNNILVAAELDILLAVGEMIPLRVRIRVRMHLIQRTELTNKLGSKPKPQPVRCDRQT